MTHGRRPASKDPSHVIVMGSMREVVDVARQAPGVDRIVDHFVIGAVNALA